MARVREYNYLACLKILVLLNDLIILCKVSKKGDAKLPKICQMFAISWMGWFYTRKGNFWRF